MTIKPLGDEDGEVEFELSTTGQWGAIGFNKEKNKMVRTWSDIYISFPCGSSFRRLLH